MSSVRASKASNVHLSRRKSNWNNTSCMCEILDLLAHALKVFPRFQPILLLDTASCHISDKVAALAAALNMWLVPVPAGLTYLLQPLDVCVFFGYKEFLRQQYRKIRAEKGMVTAEMWLQLLFAVCMSYLNGRRWSPAFSQVGLSAKASGLSTELQFYFPAGKPQLANTCITSAELARLIPVNRHVRALLWVRAPAGRKRILTIL